MHSNDTVQPRVHACTYTYTFSKFKIAWKYYRNMTMQTCTNTGQWYILYTIVYKHNTYCRSYTQMHCMQSSCINSE